jgi:hypothetical protein
MKIGSLNLSGLFVFLLLAVTTASCGEPENAKGEIREWEGSSEGLQGVTVDTMLIYRGVPRAVFTVSRDNVCVSGLVYQTTFSICWSAYLTKGPSIQVLCTLIPAPKAPRAPSQLRKGEIRTLASA